MKHIWVIFKREFFAYFNSPIAYIFIIVFLFLSCGFFTLFFLAGNAAEMRIFFSTVMPIVLAFFMPAVTMRMWAEERRSGTIGLLLSLPAKNHELVLGKFLASLVFFLIALAGTLTIPIMVGLAGEPDCGPIISGYIGTIFLGAFFLAVGLFVSVLFKDQILAFVIALLLCVLLLLLGWYPVTVLLDGWVGGFGTMIKNAVGASNRLDSFGQGVLDIGDIIYFLTFIAGFLLLNVYALESHIRMRGASIFPAGVALVLTIAVVINMFVSSLGLGRFDLTREGRYSLSPATHSILSRLKARVKVRYYVTPEERMPTHTKNLQRDVTDLLSELAMASSNFTFEVIDPTAEIVDPAADLETREKRVETQKKLQERGIVPFNARTMERDSIEMKRVYSTISITYLDKPEEILPHVVPQALGQLEYALVSRIFRMTLERKPTVAVYAPLQYVNPRFKDPAFRDLLRKMRRPVPQPEDHFRQLKKMLEADGYDVREIDLERDPKVPDEADALLVLEPEKLQAKQLKKIEDFIAKGKNLFVAVQKHVFTYDPAPNGEINATPIKTETGVEPLLRKFGVRVSDDILMDQSREFIRVRMTRQMGPMMLTRPEEAKFPVQIMVTEQNMNKETGITDRLSSLFYFCGSALDVDEKAASAAGLKVRPLFTSSAQAWKIPSKATQLADDDIDPQKHKMLGPLPLSVHITGPAPGAKDKSKTAKVIIVGCAQMFSDSFLGAPSNATFLLNAVDALALGEELISIRSKGDVVRMVRTDMTDGEKLFHRFLTLALVPIIFAAAGIVRSVLRKRRRAAYMRKFAPQ